MREIVFDTETTGLSAQKGDRLVEIGCIELVNRVKTGREYHAYFNPERAMPSEAQAIHGLSDAFLSDKPLFADKAEELLAFLGDSPLVAHNAKFDFSFLNQELENCGRAIISLDQMVDTLAIARTKHPGAKHSLDALCSRYGIDRSHRVLHGALLDAELLSQLYVELTGGRQIGMFGEEVPIVTAATHISESRAPITVQRVARAARPHGASPEEILRHTEFVNRLTDPLWLQGGGAG